MTTDITDVLDAEGVEVEEVADDLAPQTRPKPEQPSADADADADSKVNADADADAATTSELPRAELLNGELWPEREVSRAIVTTGIVCGVAGFALGYWLGNRERWSL